MHVRSDIMDDHDAIPFIWGYWVLLSNRTITPRKNCVSLYLQPHSGSPGWGWSQAKGPFSEQSANHVHHPQNATSRRSEAATRLPECLHARCDLTGGQACYATALTARKFLWPR